MTKCKRCGDSWPHDEGLHDRLPPIPKDLDEFARLAAAESPEDGGGQMTESMARCSICKVQILELPAYEYCKCEDCKGHQISKAKMGCEHQGAIDLPDLITTINHYRSEALDEIIRSYKEDAKKNAAYQEAVRPFVESLVKAADKSSKKG